MMPMVFSATTLSMPAFAASRPINSSILPALIRLRAGPFIIEFILIWCAANYKRRPHAKTRFSFDRTTSVAAMQEWARHARPNCRGPAHALQLSLQAGARPVDPVWRPVSDRHGEALTGFNRLARCHMMLAPGR